MGVKYEFESDYLDHRNWVADFGNFKLVKAVLQDFFDHKTIVAEDDPHLDWFKEAHERGIMEMVIVPHVGCERFAELAYAIAYQCLEIGTQDRIRLVSAEVTEHESNSAIFAPSSRHEIGSLPWITGPYGTHLDDVIDRART